MKNPIVGVDSRSLIVQFSNELGSASIPFADLSDGEKCFMICALVVAANATYGPLICFWDEPDNYLALSEVAHFVVALRQTFQTDGQFIATSHNPEAIRSFSNENTCFSFGEATLNQLSFVASRKCKWMAIWSMRSFVEMSVRSGNDG